MTYGTAPHLPRRTPTPQAGSHAPGPPLHHLVPANWDRTRPEAPRLVLPDDTPTQPIPVVLATTEVVARRRSGTHARRVTTIRAATGVRLLVVPVAIGAAQLPWWSDVLARWPRQGPVGALLAVPLLAGVVGWRRLRTSPPGPQIHDRQLDMILCVALAALAVEFLRLADEHGRGSIYGAGFLVVATAAITTAGWGTRALSQLRASLALLLLAWQWPWEALARAACPAASRLATALATGPLDPLAGGGVLLPVGIGLLCGVAWAAQRRGLVRRGVAALAGLMTGMIVSAAQWIITGWAATRSVAAVGAWESSTVQLWTVLALFPLAVGLACARRLMGRTEIARSPAGPSGTLQAARRLAAAVPRARLATSVVVALAVGLFLLTARAVPSSVLGVLS